MQSHSSPGRRLKTMQIPWQKVSWYAAADIDAAPRPLEYSTQGGDFEPDLILQRISEMMLFALLVQRSNEGLKGHKRVCVKTKGSCKVDATLNTGQQHSSSGCNTVQQHSSLAASSQCLLTALSSHVWVFQPF